MPFDINTAKPTGKGFDISSAKEISRTNIADMEEIGSAPELNELSTAAMKASLAASLITNEKELGQALQSHIPGSSIIEDDKGNLIAKLPSGDYALNKPGLSPQDFAQFFTRALLFTPAGRGIKGMALPALVKAAGQSAATEAGLQAVESEVGGEFTPSEVGISGAVAPLGHVVGETVLSPLARAVGGKVDEGMKSLIKKANENNVDILTTDVVPPQTFAGRTLQQLGEKLGPFGTGGKRAVQQKARTQVVEDLAQEMGIALDEPVESGIFSSLKKGLAQQLNKAAVMRNEAVKSLDTFGNVPITNANESIKKQIGRQVRLREDASQVIIDRLESLQRSLEDADFSLVKDLRSNLIDDIRSARKGDVLPTKAEAPLQSVKKAIDNDLLAFAKEKDRSAAAKWVQSNRIFADGYTKAKDTELKRLLKKGEGTPELVSTILKAGRPSELKRLDSLLDDQGRRNAQISLIRDALVESGFFNTGPNPDRFASALSKPNRMKAVNVFFKGKDKDQIEGIRRVLNATRRAQEAPLSTATGQQLAAPVAAIAASQFDGGVSIGVGATLSAISRAYESTGMRNLLIRLSNAPPGSPAERKILDQLMPMFSGMVQGARSNVKED